MQKKVAFSKDKGIWTYERLAAEVDHLAYGLVKRGPRKGDRVALHMANLAEFVVAYHACFSHRSYRGTFEYKIKNCRSGAAPAAATADALHRSSGSLRQGLSYQIHYSWVYWGQRTKRKIFR
jgi:hypothetical protein